MATVVRWDPAYEVDSLQGEMNRLFNGFFGTGSRGAAAGRWVPPMDLSETEDSLVLTADLPGMTEADISVEVKDGTLAVTGERQDHRHGEGTHYHRAERTFGRFSRTLSLPRGIDAAAVEARFENGVLEIHIPKPEERKPHKVTIGAGSERAAIEGGATEKE